MIKGKWRVLCEISYKVKGKLVSSSKSYKKDLLPLGLSDNIKVIKPIAKNSFISFDDVENNLDREIIKAREYQFQLLEKWFYQDNIFIIYFKNYI